MIRRIVLACSLLCAILSGPARSEVAARLGSDGTYQCMSYRYNVTGGSSQLWSISTIATNRRYLNPNGDLYHDLAPTVAENPVRSNWPIAVWPRPVGADFDLVYSAWGSEGWSPVRFVQLDTPYSELEPRIAFNSLGHAYMVWWSEEGGVGAVYFSVFLNDTELWTPPTRVSRMSIDSRRANLTIVNDGLTQVSYQTARGLETRDVIIVRTDTITDDIDPKFQITVP